MGSSISSQPAAGGGQGRDSPTSSRRRVEVRRALSASVRGVNPAPAAPENNGEQENERTSPARDRAEVRVVSETRE